MERQIETAAIPTRTVRRLVEKIENNAKQTTINVTYNKNRSLNLNNGSESFTTTNIAEVTKTTWQIREKIIRMSAEVMRFA
jgi:hypothetical protein